MSGLAIGLTCRELAELVTDYVEGVLPRWQRIRFRLHISGCRNCRRYVEQMRVTIAATGRLRAEDIAPEVRDELLAAFRGWKAEGSGPSQGAVPPQRPR